MALNMLLKLSYECVCMYTYVHFTIHLYVNIYEYIHIYMSTHTYMHKERKQNES